MPDPTTPPADGQQGTEGATPPAAGATPPASGAPASGTPEKTFTQAELDAIIGERLKRATPPDYAELKRKAEAFDAAEAANQTELQKAQAKAEKAEQSAREAQATANGVLRRAAIIEQAAAQNAVDAEAVIAMLASDETIVVADGAVTGAKEAVKKLLAAKPFLVKGATPSTSGGEFGGQETKTLDARIKEAEAKGDWALARRLKLDRMRAAPPA